MKVSSRMTFFYKWVFPTVWFGILGAVLMGTLISQFTSNKAPKPFLIVPLVLMAFGYVLMRKLCFDLIDEVIDHGEYLLAKNRGEEERIKLSNIQDVNCQYIGNPQRVSLTLRADSKFGRIVTFMPPIQWIPFRKSQLIEELIVRIKKSQRGSNTI